MKVNEITHDKRNSQLYLEVELKTELKGKAETKNARALIDYKIRNDRMYLTHSEVPKTLRGNGIGKILVEKSLEKLVEEGYDKEYRIIANCPFIKYVVAKSDKWREIIE